ncbi:MAG: radical SAM protein, partial [Bacteroidales bacterium]|nr:radical SAM protein [Bacteroidales bacterium]
LKLDSAIETTAKAIDRPVGSYSVPKIIDLLKTFDGNFTLQTMFLEGDVNGVHINNMTDEEVSAWLEVVKITNPKKIMIYTIDRDTPEQNLRKATHDELDAIRDRVKAEGFDITVSY